MKMVRTANSRAISSLDPGKCSSSSKLPQQSSHLHHPLNLSHKHRHLRQSLNPRRPVARIGHHICVQLPLLRRAPLAHKDPVDLCARTTTSPVRSSSPPWALPSTPRHPGGSMQTTASRRSSMVFGTGRTPHSITYSSTWRTSIPPYIKLMATRLLCCRLFVAKEETIYVVLSPACHHQK